MPLLILHILVICLSLLSWIMISIGGIIFLQRHKQKLSAIVPPACILLMVWIVNTYILYKAFFLCQPPSGIYSNIFDLLFTISTTVWGSHIIWKNLYKTMKRDFHQHYSILINAPAKLLPPKQKKEIVLTKKQKDRVDAWLKSPELITSKITLEKLAEEVIIDKADLSTYIRQKTGVSLSEYINSIRLAQSEEALLKNNNESIIAISEEAGFQAPSTFYRLFKKRHQLSPLEWKKQMTPNSKSRKDS